MERRRIQDNRSNFEPDFFAHIKPYWQPRCGDRNSRSHFEPDTFAHSKPNIVSHIFPINYHSNSKNICSYNSTHYEETNWWIFHDWLGLLEGALTVIEKLRIDSNYDETPVDDQTFSPF
mmetsp:Transcript_23491/g.47535  ORF Transcript_23491/g.47535 Transcript_23491/m.47535 type:complete len:119 (-) Transcript_23491:154-510(-)